MEWEAFGIPRKKHSFRDWVIGSHYPKKWSTRCPQTSSLTENYGSVPASTCKFSHTLLTTLNRFGRNSFQEAAKLANRIPFNEIDWTKFKYMVFDIPTHKGTYEERYALLGNPFLPPPKTLFKLTSAGFSCHVREFAPSFYRHSASRRMQRHRAPR